MTKSWCLKFQSGFIGGDTEFIGHKKRITYGRNKVTTDSKRQSSKQYSTTQRRKGAFQNKDITLHPILPRLHSSWNPLPLSAMVEGAEAETITEGKAGKAHRGMDSKNSPGALAGSIEHMEQGYAPCRSPGRMPRLCRDRVSLKPASRLHKAQELKTFLSFQA